MIYKKTANVNRSSIYFIHTARCNMIYRKKLIFISDIAYKDLKKALYKVKNNLYKNSIIQFKKHSKRMYL